MAKAGFILRLCGTAEAVPLQNIEFFGLCGTAEAEALSKNRIFSRAASGVP